MIETKWNLDLVQDFIVRHGGSFERLKTPRGMRTDMKKIFDNKPLEGRCFRNNLVVAAYKPDKFWYCEGIVLGKTSKHGEVRWLPHAWLNPKNNDDYALDFTWPYWKDNRSIYYGVRFDGTFAIKHHKLLRAPYVNTDKVPPGGLSLLSHLSILHGIVPGFKEQYAF